MCSNCSLLIGCFHVSMRNPYWFHPCSCSLLIGVVPCRYWILIGYFYVASFSWLAIISMYYCAEQWWVKMGSPDGPRYSRGLRCLALTLWACSVWAGSDPLAYCQSSSRYQNLDSVSESERVREWEKRERVSEEWERERRESFTIWCRLYVQCCCI